MALALYRRYRPDTFDGIIGQDQVTIPLSRALDENRLTHAYLFSGPRGCGKTSSARIFARCVNCAKGPTSHPCGECESCRDLATGGPGSIDVVEIDAASHNGVDDARELRERAGFAPARDRYKIFILDEAHMVTQQGFNALLKIVEEPPEHVMFIFATTEPDKVIGTIRSRTHHYPFRLVPREIMGPYLEKICGQEQVQADPGVLKLTMRAGGGSVRDTLSVLDQLMVGSVDGRITYDSAVALLGFTPEALISQAVDAVINHDGPALYGIIQKVVVGGFEPQRFVEDLLARVRDLLVLKLAGDQAESVLSEESESDEADDLHRQADALDLSLLTAMADVINKTLASMGGATSPRMRLELLAARLLAIGFEPVEQKVQAGGQRAPLGGQDGYGPASGGAHAGFIGSERRKSETGRPQQKEPTAQAVAGTGPGSDSGRDSDAGRGPLTAPGQAEDSGARGRDAQGLSDKGPQATDRTHEAEGPARPDQGRGVPAEGELDKRWDALVAALPPQVAEYVVRSKVQTVSMRQGPSGRQMLALTFDRPLSQHAFAMAVASSPVDGETAVPKIVLVRARQEFGAKTMIAPSGVAANGEKVESVNRMSPERRAEVKKQVALAKANLTAVNLGSALKPRAGSGVGRGAGNTAEDQGSAAEGDGSSADAGTADDGSGVHPAGPPSGGPVGSGPVNAPLPDVSTSEQATSSPSDSLPSAGFASTDSYVTPDSDEQDPWALSQQAPVISMQETQEDGGSSSPNRNAHAGVDGNADGPAHDAKKVAVPDLSDDTDPWALPDQDEADDGAAAGSAPDPEGNAPSEPGQGRGDLSPSRNSAVVDSVGTGQPAVAGGIGSDSTRVVQVNGGWSGSESDGPVQAVGAGQPAQPAQPAQAARAPQVGDGAGTPIGFRAQGESGKGKDLEDPSEPTVDPDEDAYSLNDSRLGAGTAMDQDQLADLFDVKQVEDFVADDPRNPLNVQKRKRQQQQRQQEGE